MGSFGTFLLYLLYLFIAYAVFKIVKMATTRKYKGFRPNLWGNVAVVTGGSTGVAK